MKRNIIFAVLVGLCAQLRAEVFPSFGVDSVGSQFFREWYINGDLLVLVEEEEHKDFLRDGSDLVYNLLLDMPTAILGGQVQIPTLQGEAKITISPGTQPGKVLRMRGKGLPMIDNYARQYGTGDMLINVGVYIPEALNKEEKKMIEKLKESENVRPGASDKKNFFKNLFG